MSTLPRTEDADHIVEIPCEEYAFALVFEMRAGGNAGFRFLDYQNSTIAYRTLSYRSLSKLRKWLEENEAGLDVTEAAERDGE